MEVAVKKVKLTLSLIRQIQYATLSQVETYKVIGWISDHAKGKSTRKILLYSEEDNMLAFYYYPSLMELRDIDYVKHDKCRVYVNGEGRYTDYHFEDEEKAQAALNNLNCMCNNAKTIGQIFY